MDERERETRSVEYSIRKLERGVKVSHKCRTTIQGSSVDYDNIISKYVKEIKELRDRLEKLTEKKCFSSGRWRVLTKGRRSPNRPKWPV